MLRRDLEAEFRRHLDLQDTLLAKNSVKSALKSVVDFYRLARFQDCKLDDNGDMLLFQWGIYDWGDGKFFDIDFTRQLIDCKNDDRPITQVSFRIAHPVVEDMTNIPPGNFWCEHLDFANRFLEDVYESRPYQIALRSEPNRIDLKTVISR